MPGPACRTAASGVVWAICSRTVVGAPPVEVDTIGLSFPVRRFDLEGDGVRMVVAGRPNGGETRAARRDLPGGGFVGSGVGGMAWVEASLPKRVCGQNGVALELNAAVRAARDLVAEACRFVEPGEPRRVGAWDGVRGGFEVSADNPRVVRLDLVRDFRLVDPGRLGLMLDGLASVPRERGTKVRRFADGHSNHAETLRVGPMGWAATLYDKHLESRGAVPAGSLRCEFRLRSRQLASTFASRHGGRILTLTDLTEGRCEGLRRGWFDRVRFGAWVAGTSALWDALDTMELSDREKAMFVGWLSAREAHRALRFSDKTERKFRAVLCEVGLRLPGAEHGRIRLDYDLGCELVEAA